MKNLINKTSIWITTTVLFLTVVVILGGISCNKLDLQPLDKVTPSEYYITASDFDGATFAAYSALQDWWGTSTETLSERGEFWAITLATTDDVTINTLADNQGDQARAKKLDQLNIESSDIPFGAIYTEIYKGIYRANLVIENTENGRNKLTDDQKKAFVAEAKFLRAFNHFVALQMWGTPPIADKVLTDLNNLALPNSTQDALYQFILDDLKAAFDGLPSEWDPSNVGRATKWSARALEGKVNVWKKDWPAAITAFEDVITNGHYALMDGNALKKDNFEDVFDFKKENSTESVFEIQYGGPQSDDNLWVFDDTHSEAFKASQGTARVWYWDAPAGAGAPGGNMGWYAPTQSLVDEFEAGDPRLEVSIYKDGDTYYTNGVTLGIPFDPAWSSTGYLPRKYGGIRNAPSENYSPNGEADFNNERFFRYADMLLLYAEALIQSGRTPEAMDIINNQIRARVGLGPSPKAAGMDALMHERRVELAFEPGRWFDITRWGIGATVFGANWNDKFNLFPFPQSEITRSNGLLVQNPGY